MLVKDISLHDLKIICRFQVLLAFIDIEFNY